MRHKGASWTVIEREGENDKREGVKEERQDVAEDRHKIPGEKKEREKGGPLMTDLPLN